VSSSTLLRRGEAWDNQVMVLVAAVRAAIRGVGVFALILGATTWLGGAARMSSPSYAAAVALANRLNVAPATLWGSTLMAAGVLVLLCRRTRVVGMLLVASWCLFFALSLLISALANPRAGLTGVVVYAFVGVMVAGLASVKHAGLLK
jgi:hypothetical protein